MTRAPHITNNTLSRTRCHLRTHHDAPIQLPTWQAWMTPTKSRASCTNTDKPDPELDPMSSVQRVWQIRFKAPATRQSP